MLVMKDKEKRFSAESRDAAYRRLRGMTVSLATASFAAAAVFGLVAHATIPGGTSAVASSAVSNVSSNSSSTSATTSGTSSASSTSSGSAVAVSGGS